MSWAGVNCYSVLVRQYNQYNQRRTQNREINMPKQKKKTIKVRDLKPKKDAKGGVLHLGSQNKSNLGSSTGSSLGSNLGASH
jgi:hypothetical protein